MSENGKVQMQKPPLSSSLFMPEVRVKTDSVMFLLGFL